MCVSLIIVLLHHPHIACMTHAQLSEYLEINVTPYLAKCLVDIERLRPADPVSFLIDFLEKQSAKNQAEARDHALKTFSSELEHAEIRYRQEMI